MVGHGNITVVHHNHSNKSNTDEWTGSPHFWSLLVQMVCALCIGFVAILMMKKSKSSHIDRLQDINFKLRQIDERLGLQTINYNLMTQIGRKTDMPIEDESGVKTKLNRIRETICDSGELNDQAVTEGYYIPPTATQ